jgi:hypothetical protein
MLFIPTSENRIGRLTSELRHSSAITTELMSHVIADGCTRFSAMSESGMADRFNRLVQSGAWTDAALALIELELPAWKLRRLVYEDGEWFCSLSRQPNLPETLDDTADASHVVLPLAILCAFLEARRMTNPAPEPNSVTAPQLHPASGHAVCCDNFA